MYWSLRYRHPRRGVEVVAIEAVCAEKAAAVGQKWCNDQPQHVYISVTPWCVADESILPKPAEAEKPKGKAA